MNHVAKIQALKRARAIIKALKAQEDVEFYKLVHDLGFDPNGRASDILFDYVFNGGIGKTSATTVLKEASQCRVTVVAESSGIKVERS